MTPESGILFEVVHADDDIAVVDKPAGLVAVHQGRPRRAPWSAGLLDHYNLAALVAEGVATDLLAPPRRPASCRLDKGTSGLLAVARTAEAYASSWGSVGHPDDGTPLRGPGPGAHWPRTGKSGGAHRPLGPDTDQNGRHRLDEPARTAYTVANAGRPHPPRRPRPC